MGWFRRRRRPESRVVFLSATGQPVTPAFAPRPVPAVPPPPAPAPPPPPVETWLPPAPEPEPEEPRGGVRLGFVDGSEIRLPDDDPAAVALLAAADALRRSAERPIGR